MAVLHRDVSNVANELRDNPILAKVFRAAVDLNGGPLLEIARKLGTHPQRIKEYLGKLEELELVEQSSINASMSSFSVYYQLTQFAYEFLARYRE